MKDSNNVTIQNVSVTNCGTQDTCIGMNGDTHDIIIEDFHCFGNNNTGWCVGGDGTNKNITVRRGLIEDMGQAGGVQTHGMYIEHWSNAHVEDVTILRPWNNCIKTVGTLTNVTFNRVIMRDCGRSGVTGGGIALGQSDGNFHANNVLLSNSEIRNTKAPNIYVLDNTSGFRVENTICISPVFTCISPTGGSTPSPIKTTPPLTGTAKAGDVNGDNAVNLIDIGIIIDNYSKNISSYPKTDLNGDRVINIVDIGIVITNYGK